MVTSNLVNEADMAEDGTGLHVFPQRGAGSLEDAQFALRLLAERLPAEFLQGRLRTGVPGVGEVVSGLRQTFQGFINMQIDDAQADPTGSTGFGFGHAPFEEVDVKPLTEATHKALRDLTHLYDALPEGLSTTLAHRDAIIEAQALLQQFLLDFKEFAPDGALDRSSLSNAVRYCIATSRGLGKLNIGFEAVKLQMLAPAA
jgi:hypothetical protein